MNLALNELFDQAKQRPQFDPTGTGQLRQRFRSAGQLRLQLLLRQVRQAVIDYNLLGLDGTEKNAFRPTADNLQQFAGWLESAARAALDAKYWTAPFINAAIKSGVERARSELGDPTTPPSHPAFNGVHEQAHHELKGIAAALVQKAVRTAARAQTRRKAPSQAFYDLAQTVNGDIASRLQAFTHHFAVKGHNKGKIETYRANGVALVGIRPETVQRFKVDAILTDDVSGGLVGWLTAGDDDVCQICQDGADDSPYTLDEADDLIPAHINCRCAVFPWHDLRYGGDSLYIQIGDEPPGHPFRGNQYTTGESGGGSNGSTQRARPAAAGKTGSAGPRIGRAGFGRTSWSHGGTGDPRSEGGGRTVELHELTGGGAAQFHAAISAAKAANPHGASVSLHSLDDYRHDRLWLTPDHKAGFALAGGDEIVSVFKHPDSNIPKFAQAALKVAVANGGRRLDAFDTVLPHIYSQAGFRAVARVPFDDNYKPDGWNYDQFKNYNNGRPDVVFMVYDPAHAQPYKPGDGKVVGSYDEGLKVQQDEVARLANPNPDHPKSTSPKFTKEGSGSGDGKYTSASGDTAWISTEPLSITERKELSSSMDRMSARAQEIEKSTDDPQDVQEYNAINMIVAAGAHYGSLAKDKNTGFAFATDNNGSIVGSAMVRRTGKQEAELSFLGTVKQGMGEHLLKTAENLAKFKFGAKTLTLTALPAANNFYARHGYQVVEGTDPDDGEFVKTLDSAFVEVSEPPFLCAGNINEAIKLRKQK
ncbi:MAG TPA: GNAT family N-acetyltransferase [Candidatus Saccharimonadales bacterium]|nr:GNAT family N-acetyltransferase [Candidatus Saccharimonadales bacterium]